MDPSQVGPALVAAGYSPITSNPDDPSTWGKDATWYKPKLETREVTDAKGNKTQQIMDVGGSYMSEAIAAYQQFGGNSPYGNPSPAQTAAGSGGNAPDITYDAEGKAYRWQNGQAVPMPQFDNPTKAAGYRAPSQAAPLAPHIQVAANGDIYKIDPYTGQPTLAGSAPALATNPNLTTYTGSDGTLWTINPQTGETKSTGVQVATSAADLRAQQLADAQAGRNFTAQQNTQQQQATAANQQNQQGFTALQNANAAGASAVESANQRALNAAEFAATQAGQQQQLQFSVDQANAQGERQAGQDRLAAANQYANLVSSTDTAALPAYLQAGGGVLWNAKANPNAPSMLTDNAINPAAASLQQARTIAWKPITAAPVQGFQQPAYQTFTPQAYQPGQAAQQTGAAVPPPTFSGAGSALTNPNAAQQNAGIGQSAPISATGQSADNLATIRAAQSLGIDTSQQAPGFALGTGNGFIPAPHQGFLTSEQGAEYMRVVDPPGPNNARIMVMPHPQTMGMLRGFAGGTLPGYADGTADPNAVLAGAGGDGSSDPNSLDPYAAEVRQFRSTFNAPQYGFSQFDPRFSRQLSPGMQQSYFMGQQTQSGVPAEALQSQAAFYTPVGYHSQPYHVTPDLAY